MSVYGRTAYGDRSFEGLGPSLASSFPTTGATSTGTDVLTYFTVTSEAGIDVSLFNVYDGTTPVILGGVFVGDFDGVVTLGAQDCDVVVSKYPVWASGEHTINIDVTDLAGTQDDLSYTFNTASTGNIVDVNETITVSDTVSTDVNLVAAPSETVSVSEGISTQYGANIGLGETVSASESLTLGSVALLDETVAVSDGVVTEYGAVAELSETVSASESKTVSSATSQAVGETVSVFENVVLRDAVELSESVSVGETLAISEGETRSLNETVLVSETVQAEKGQVVSVSDSVSVSEVVGTLQENHVGLSETVSVTENIGILNPVRIGETVTVAESAAAYFTYGVNPSETVAVTDDVNIGENNQVIIDSLPGTADRQFFRLKFPVPLSWSPRSEQASITALTLTSPDGGVPAAIIGATKEFSTYHTGHLGRLVLQSIDESKSNRFRVPGQYSIDASLIGEYLEISSGSNEGIYKIVGLDGTDLVIDTEMPLTDTVNGYVQGKVEYVSQVVGPTETVHTFRLVNGRVTVSDPLIELVYTDRRDGPLPGIAALGSSYNTIEITVNNATPWLNPEEAFVYVVARISPKTDWRIVSGVTSFLLETSKLTAGKIYELSAKSLLTSEGQYVDFVGYALLEASDVQIPRLIAASTIGDEGAVLVTYDQPMQPDEDNLFSTSDYALTGPITVFVQSVKAYGSNSVVLVTTGMEAGDYTLTVSTGTPKDVAGNPLDPTFNTAIFTVGASPLASRSIFVDKGPIAKPPLTIQSGTGVTFDSFALLTLAGASLTNDHVGKFVTIDSGGSSTNEGTYRITSVVTSSQVRLQASFTLPDTVVFTWEVFDPQDGIVADDPGDVTVRINGSPVTPEAVVGLLGQVVLSTAPSLTDDVTVDYSWCCNPTVDIRRLNSAEFRFNAWNQNYGQTCQATQHQYRYNNVLVRPSDYDSDDPRALLDQPKERELHYRGYERAYTAVLNDPTLLVFNTPIHRIAYPPARRLLAEEFVTYEGLSLPESLVVNPWERVGSGTAVVSSGHLVVTDDTSGSYPTGQPIFWRREIDTTYPHVFAMSWRFTLTMVAEATGVFSGVAAGYSDDSVAIVVGFLEDGGVKKFGILKRGYGDDPSDITAWVGGLDSSGNSTAAPSEVDWSTIHSYRLLRGIDGVIRIYVDGDIEEILRITPDELPFLEELDAPFDAIQGVFFGSLSRPARNISDWDFIRYLTQPTNPIQTSPSSFTSYEANVVPEADSKPWTPIGFHGTSTILSTDFLLLDSTSASDVSDVGLIGGDFHGYLRFEPLLGISSEMVVDAQVQVLTHTHGFDPNGVMFAVDDGTRLMQVCFISDQELPKISYGGRSLPGDFTPFSWASAGSQTAEMAGRILRITDASATDGLVYYYDDVAPAGSDDRTLESTIDYMLECRCRVVSYTVDGSGYAGTFFQAYDGIRVIGLLLEEVSGTRYASLQSDGVVLAQFAFEWNDSAFHTYRLRKSTSGNLVSLFIDGSFVGSLAYSSFTSPGVSTTGQISFGSSTPASIGSESVVDWAYCNTWRVRGDVRHYIGLWRGSSTGTLQDYHVPLKAAGRGASVVGNVLTDANASFVVDGVAAGDQVVVDEGPNAGIYEVSAATPTTLVMTTTFSQQPSEVDYRVAEETDWTTQHKYRLARDSNGTVSLLLDTGTQPIVQVEYGAVDLPASGSGLVRTLSGGLAAITFGAFDVEGLSQSSWDFVRYGLTRSPTELRIVPQHEILNQWNVMSSPERLFTQLPHNLTDFKSSSTGIVPKEDPDFLEDPGLTAFTVLNEQTPLVPLTQAFETRSPYPVQEFISALNRPEDVLNNDGGFTLNDGTRRFKLIVPDDVLYSCLDVIEQTIGEQSLIKPFSDGCGCASDMKLEYTQEVCLTYDGDVLPESDTAAPTPWDLVSDSPAQVSTTVFSSVLTYGTLSGGTRTVYRNNTPLPDAPGLRTEAQFKMRVLNDGTLGTDDTQIRAGLSAPNLTVALAFVTTPLAERYILVIDLNNGNVMGSITFDYLDGNYHTYHIVRDPGAGVVQVSIS
jgi:hypothetical protein